MTVLMFGWEFPPHISGGLGTACYGLTQGLLKEKSLKLLFVVPKAHGDEAIPLINASEVRIHTTPVKTTRVVSKTTATGSVENLVTLEVSSALTPYTSPHITAHTQEIKHWSYAVETVRSEHGSHTGGFTYKFSGSYGPALFDEVTKYAEVAAVVSKQHTFDVIHAHDWLTYPAGIRAKKESGKALVIHVHATEFDRSGEHVDPRVFAIEQKGMLQADHIVAVSQWTKNIIVDKYKIPKAKVTVVHNGVANNSEPFSTALPKVGEHIVTFLGRITFQKGPQYFIEAAHQVLKKFPNTHFVMAGSGDLLPGMMERVASLRMSSRFHFTGFLKGQDVNKIWSVSSLYVMPSVSEPFGITPLEAIEAGVPVIISNQSGVGEVMPHAIKTDFWNTDTLADAICNVLKHKSLANTLKRQSKKALQQITWDKAAKKITRIYNIVKTNYVSDHKIFP